MGPHEPYCASALYSVRRHELLSPRLLHQPGASCRALGEWPAAAATARPPPLASILLCDDCLTVRLAHLGPLSQLLRQ